MRARVTAGDIAATRAYLHARHELANRSTNSLPSDEVAVHALISSVTSECPNVLASPQTTSSTPIKNIENEIFGVVSHTLERSQRTPTIAFARKVERLHWSNSKLNYFIHGSAEEDMANAELVLPDICSDARAVAASGFQSTPSSTTRFLQQSEAANSKVDIVVKPPENPPGELEEKILKLLKPYERPDERSLIPRKPSRGEVEKAESVLLKLLFGASEEIARALGLRGGAVASQTHQSVP